MASTRMKYKNRKSESENRNNTLNTIKQEALTRASILTAMTKVNTNNESLIRLPSVFHFIPSNGIRILRIRNLFHTAIRAFSASYSSERRNRHQHSRGRATI
jgi:hypothetical protein